MSKTFQLDIITPTQVLNLGQVDYLRGPSIDGLFGIQKGHASSIILLDVGELKVTKNGKDFYYATNGGFADIRPESVLLVVETAEIVTEINKKRVEDSIRRAEKRFNDGTDDLSRAQSSIKRARNRLKILNRIK